MNQIPAQPFFVDRLKSQVSGVDYLGLGQVNERMIAEFLPGISNVTRYMRTYSAMTWMAWSFDRWFQDAGAALPRREIASRFKQYREKVEILFTWGNLGRGIGIAGNSRSFPEGKQAVRLTFSDMGTQKVSWLDAAQYGPTLRAGNGLGFLEERAGKTLGPTESGRTLAKALDKLLRGSRFYDQLANPDEDMGVRRMAMDLGERWSILDSSPSERRIFREAFIGQDDSNLALRGIGDRRVAATLIMEAVAHLRGRASVQQVREVLARSATPQSMSSDGDATRKVRVSWAVLQIRQLQRLCLEAMLRWVELALIDPDLSVPSTSPSRLAKQAAELCCNSIELQVGAPLSAVTALLVRKLGANGSPYVTGRLVGAVDPFVAMQRLQSLRGSADEFERVPGEALKGIAIAALQVQAFADDDEFTIDLDRGGSTRLSLAHLREIFAAYQNRPIGEFFEVLVESWTIGQHYATAASRLEADKNKYRFLPSDEGLKPLITPAQVLRLGVTADRLQTGMDLMADCALLGRESESKLYIAVQ